MSERKLLSYILIIAFFAILIGGGSYFYFVGNPLERFWPTESTPPLTDGGPTATPTPVEPELLQKPADVVGIVEAIDGQTLTVRSMEESFSYSVLETTKIYQIRTDILSNPPLTKEITLEQIEAESKISIYFNEDETIRAIFVANQ